MKNHYSKSEYKNRKKKLQKNYSYIEMCKTMNNSKNFSKTFSNSFGHTKSKPKLSNTINKNTPSTPLNPYSTFGNGDLFRNCSAIKNKLSLSLHKISGNKMYENNTLFNNDKKELKITNKNNKNNFSVQVAYSVDYSKSKDEDKYKKNIIQKDNNYFYVSIYKKEEEKEKNNIKYNNYVIDKQKTQNISENNIPKIMMEQNVNNININNFDKGNNNINNEMKKDSVKNLKKSTLSVIKNDNIQFKSLKNEIKFETPLNNNLKELYDTQKKAEISPIKNYNQPNIIRINKPISNEINNENNFLNEKNKINKNINNNNVNNDNKNNTTKLKYSKNIIKNILEQNKHYSKTNTEKINKKIYNDFESQFSNLFLKMHYGLETSRKVNEISKEKIIKNFNVYNTNLIKNFNPKLIINNKNKKNSQKHSSESFTNSKRHILLTSPKLYQIQKEFNLTKDKKYSKIDYNRTSNFLSKNNISAKDNIFNSYYNIIQNNDNFYNYSTKSSRNKSMHLFEGVNKIINDINKENKIISENNNLLNKSVNKLKILKKTLDGIKTGCEEISNRKNMVYNKSTNLFNVDNLIKNKNDIFIKRSNEQTMLFSKINRTNSNYKKYGYCSSHLYNKNFWNKIDENDFYKENQVNKKNILPPDL